jgi:protein-S-isoprenylcysteine O-methyltransferase Ste14
VIRALEGRIPPVAVGLGMAAAMWLIDRATEVAELTGGWPRPLAAGFCVLGALIAVAGVVSFRHARTTVDPTSPERASELVTSGVYRYTRNPMYVGFALILLGWAAMLQNAFALLGPAVFVVWIDRFQVRFEERAMRAKFADAFEAYCRRTRRWL